MSTAALLPLPWVGVRGCAGDEVLSKQASLSYPASTHPSPQSSPRRGEDAKAKAKAKAKGMLMAITRPSLQSSPQKGEEADAKCMLMASTYPSPHSFPRRGEDANARSPSP